MVYNYKHYVYITCIFALTLPHHLHKDVIASASPTNFLPRQIKYIQEKVHKKSFQLEFTTDNPTDSLIQTKTKHGDGNHTDVI